jgi:hypothetical protein
MITGPGVSRRRLIGACAAGLGTACATGNARAAEGGQPARPDLAGTVLGAFRRHRLAAIGEYHGLQEHHDALVTLLTDPRFPGLADDVVIEFGNSLHQEVADRFMLALEPVPMSRPDPAIYLDQAYWAELQRRNRLQGGVADLNALRLDQPVRFTPQAVPPPLLCP